MLCDHVGPYIEQRYRGFLFSCGSNQVLTDHVPSPVDLRTEHPSRGVYSPYNFGEGGDITDYVGHSHRTGHKTAEEPVVHSQK